MDINGVHIRDRIELSPQLISSFPLTAIRNNQLATSQVPRLTFIGNEVILKSGTTQIDDFDVVIVADALSVENSNSLLLVNKTTIPENGKPGSAGHSVNINCRDLRGIRVRSLGGRGGGGLPFTPGEVAPGKDGRAGEDCFEINQHGAMRCVIAMTTPPGRGAQGKSGMQGGAGGQINLSFVNDRVPGGFNPGVLESIGGSGGPGGPGGPGGCTIFTPWADPDDQTNPLPPDERRCSGSFKNAQGVFVNYQGPQGAQGVTGASGTVTPAQVTRIAEPDYWSKVNSLLGDQAKASAEHRLQSAEYYFRAYDPIDHPTYLGIALAQLKAAAQLNPTDTRAADYRDYILNNLNILGHDRKLSLIPDFDHYYQILANNEPAIRNIFFQAANSLLHEADLGLFKADVQARAAHLNDQLTNPDSGLNRDLSDANQSVKDADSERKAANKQREEVASKISRLEQDLASDPPDENIIFGKDGGFKLFAGVALTVIGTAVLPGLGTSAGVLVGSLLSFGKDLVGNQGAVNTVTSILENSIDIGQNIETELNKLSSGAKGLSDYIPDFEKYLKESQGDTKAASEKLKKQLEQEWSQAKGLVNSFSKIEQELSGAKTGDDPRQIQLVNHYRELAALTQQQLQAELRFKQAQLSVRRAQTAIDLVKQDLARLQDIVQQGEAYKKVLKTDTLKVIRAAQVMQSKLLTFIFRAARALQIFTLSSDSQIKVRYDYGYIHPDIERDYLEDRLLPADFRSKLLDAILPSGTVGQPPVDSLGYVELLEKYKNPDPSNNLVLKENIGVYSFNRLSILPAIYEPAIAEFKASQKLNFMIHPEDLWNERFDEKISGVAIKLIGVKAGSAFSCVVRQGGRTAQRRLLQGGAASQVYYQLLNPSEDVIVMQPDPLDPTSTTYIGKISVVQSDDATTLLSCWGRGVAAEWTIEIEPGIGSVNLAQLSDVEIAVEYDGFAKPRHNQSSLQQIAHMAGALLPGAVTNATVTLVKQAPATGTTVKLTSSNPNLVKVPGSVIVPAGLTTATFPIQVEEDAANTSIILTATADFTVRTRLFFPPAQPAIKVLPLGTKAGFNATVLGIAAHGKHIYATHYHAKTDDANESFGKGEVVVIDRETFKEVPNARIPVSYLPRSVAINPLTNRLYVLNRGGSNPEPGHEGASLSIFEINSADTSKLKEVTRLKLLAGLIDVAINTKTNRVYVTDNLRMSIRVIHGETNQELQMIQLPSRPWGITVDEKTNTLYVASSDRNVNPIVNAVIIVKITGETGDQTQAQLETLPIQFDPANPDPTRPTQPVEVAFNPVTNHLYVANLGGVNSAPPCVTAINLATRQTTSVKTISVARAIAVNPQLNQIYIGTDTGVQIMDGATHTIVSTIPKKLAWGIAIDPTTSQIYAGSGAEGNLMQIAAPDLKTLTQWS